MVEAERAKELKESRNWVGADKILAEAEGLAKALLDRPDRPSGLPPTFAPEPLYQALKKERRTITARAQEQVALHAVCGDLPFRSEWEGEYGKVESAAVKRVAHAPSLIDVENCTVAVLTREHCWVTTCEVRGKNAFGAKVLDRRRFSMSALGVEEIP